MSDTPKTPATGGSYLYENGELVRVEDPTIQGVEIAGAGEPSAEPEAETPPEPQAPVRPVTRREPPPPATTTPPVTDPQTTNPES